VSNLKNREWKNKELQEVFTAAAAAAAAAAISQSLFWFGAAVETLNRAKMDRNLAAVNESLQSTKLVPKSSEHATKVQSMSQ
jgi:hypothetical protein